MVNWNLTWTWNFLVILREVRFDNKGCYAQDLLSKTFPVAALSGDVDVGVGLVIRVSVVTLLMNSTSDLLGSAAVDTG